MTMKKTVLRYEWRMILILATLTVGACDALNTSLSASAATPVYADDDDDSDSDSDSESESDFALFDGTNPLNLTAGRTGVLCGNVNEAGTALEAEAFTYYFSVTNFDDAARECKVHYSSFPLNSDPDFVTYKIPVGTSLNINQSGGSNAFDSAVRLDCDAKIAGAGSINEGENVFCLSCDALGDGDFVCDGIIAN